MSKFIVFEGIDGSGKSTQAKLLAERINYLSSPTVLDRLPSDGAIGKHIRSLLLHHSDTIDGYTLQTLFAADLLDRVVTDNGIIQQIFFDRSVVLDRYYFSCFAYGQTEVSLEKLVDLQRTALNIMRPDITFYLDIEPELAMSRISTSDRFEHLDTLTTVRQNYLTLIDDLNKILDDKMDKFVTLDGSKSVNELSEEVWKIVEPTLLREE